MNPGQTGAVTILLAVFTWNPAGAATTADRCDELAAHPADPHKVATGVYWNVMDGRDALRACERALDQHPDELRFTYQYGRALYKSGRTDEAIGYLVQAADRGYEIAYVTIGYLYESELGNYGEAANWYRQGAEVGFAPAQNGLGDLYLAGHGVQKDTAVAAQWFSHAANQGYGLAQNNLGWLYQTGDGVEKNIDRAMDLYRQAALNGNPRGAHNLGRLYLEGTETRRNPGEAARWFNMGADLGYEWSMLELARVLEDSGRDLKLAQYWYGRAAESDVGEIRRQARTGHQRLTRKLKRM